MPESSQSQTRKKDRGINFATPLIWVGVGMLICICLAIGAGVFLIANPIAQSAPPPTELPALSGTWYQVYFTAPKTPDRKSDHHGGLDARLIEVIGFAQSSLDVAIYEFDLGNVAQALIEANKRGATVRLVTDIDLLNDPRENSEFKKLQQAGIPVIGGNPDAIMHNKFIVVDKKAVWTGSWNWTENETYRNNNNAIFIQSSDLARNYTATFEKIFNDKKFGNARKSGGTVPRLTIEGVTVENYFAPEDKVSGKVIARLQRATRTLDFLAFSFTDDKIGQTVLDLAQAGVQVRGVFETSQSENQYSEYAQLKKAGLDVWQDGNSFSMHHKVFILDGKTVIFGSYNFSRNADNDNDENLLIIDDPALAQQFQAEFARVYAQAKNSPKK